MSDQFLRFYHKIDLKQVKDHLMFYGALSGICAKCNHMNVKLEDHQCGGCGTAFKFVAFQNVKENKPKMVKLAAQRPSMQFVDYDDFKRLDGESKARSILG